jgi:hypothetical protein
MKRVAWCFMLETLQGGKGFTRERERDARARKQKVIVCSLSLVGLVRTGS